MGKKYFPFKHEDSSLDPKNLCAVKIKAKIGESPEASRPVGLGEEQEKTSSHIKSESRIKQLTSSSELHTYDGIQLVPTHMNIDILIETHRLNLLINFSKGLYWTDQIPRPLELEIHVLTWPESHETLRSPWPLNSTQDPPV